MALSPQFLAELRARTSLSGLISRTVKLTRAGNEWKACCPFHNEKTPSFYVNDAKSFYHCFGCSAHGDAIRWLTDQRGLAFIDAVKELAAEAGVEMPAPDPAHVERAEQRAGLHEVMAAAQEWFAGNLRSAEGAKVLAYLEQRGLDRHTIERFGFGFAPDSRSALAPALARFDEELLAEAGLQVVVDNKEPYDRFRKRLTLPIHDVRGRVIAFGGRILDAAENAPKYLNSPDTPLFDKGRTLFNLHRAAPAARKAGRLIVVEGYMDVIALAQAGIEETVAPMGTALTPEQIALLWRHADKPVICFDGDEAGQRAAMRAVERALPLLEPGKSLRFVLLPAGLDPDDLVRREGAAAMERLLDEPANLTDMIWRHESAALSLATPEDKAGLKARLLAHVDTLADKDIRALYRRELLDKFSAFAFPPRDRSFVTRTGPRMSARGMTAADVARLKRAVQGGARDQFTQAVLAGLARHPREIDRHCEALLRLAGIEPRLAEAIDLLIEHAHALEAAEQAPISAEGLLAPPQGTMCFSFLAEEHEPSEAHEDLAEAVTLLVEQPALDAAIDEATARFALNPEAAFAEQQRLRERKLEIAARLGQLARARAARDAAGYDEAGGAYLPVGDENQD